MTLYGLFDRLELTALGELVSGSIWLFPVIEAGHLIGLGLLGGSVLVVDLRLLGFGLVARPPAYLLTQTRPWCLTAIGILLATFFNMFLQTVGYNCTKCPYNRDPFGHISQHVSTKKPCHAPS